MENSGPRKSRHWSRPKAVIGGFLGVALTRPDVSAGRVRKWTALLTVAKVIRGPKREPIYNETRCERDTMEEARPSWANDVSERRAKGNGSTS